MVSPPSCSECGKPLAKVWVTEDLTYLWDGQRYNLDIYTGGYKVVCPYCGHDITHMEEWEGGVCNYEDKAIRQHAHLIPLEEAGEAAFWGFYGMGRCS